MKMTTTVGTVTCPDETLQHPRYYPRLVMTAEELTLENRYWRDRMRRHNRWMHGWGVVCGGEVCRVPNAEGTGSEPWVVRVMPLYALSPQGNEILVRQGTNVYLNRQNANASAADPQSTAPDPWCSDLPVDCRPGTLYVAIRYVELHARPVQVSMSGCGCNDSSCEYSRLCDGYEFKIFDECPTYSTKPLESFEAILGARFDCLDCPTDDWVYLARLDVDENGNVQTIDNCACRRMVVSFANAWWQCTSTAASIESIDDLRNPDNKRVQLTQGITYALRVNGNYLSSVTEASLGDGIKVTVQTPVQPTSLTLTVVVDAKAPLNGRTLVLESKGCVVAKLVDAAKVVAAERALAREEAPAKPAQRGRRNRKRT